MGAFDGLDLYQDYSAARWNEEYQCVPYVEPIVNKSYIMQYRPSGTRPVIVLGIFDELIVVRYHEPVETYAGLRYEEAVVRRNASFFEIRTSCSEMTTTTDADAEPE